MQIGAFGDIVFEVSDEVIRTFREMQHDKSGRWAVHEVMGSKPVSEFIGPGLDEINFPIQLNALFLGRRTVEEELERIGKLVDEGVVSTLVIADVIVGKFYLDSVGAATKYFGGRGEKLITETTLHLKEYVERTV